MSREVMKLALEAWQTSAYGTVQHHKAMLVAMTEVGKAALAQPEQEPVAWIDDDGNLQRDEPPYSYGPDPRPLYLVPPQRQPLTDEDLDLICEKALFCRISFQQFARSIEAAHGIKELK